MNQEELKKGSVEFSKLKTDDPRYRKNFTTPEVYNTQTAFNNLSHVKQLSLVPIDRVRGRDDKMYNISET